MRPPSPCIVGLRWAFQVGIAINIAIVVGAFVYFMVIPDFGHHPVGALLWSVFAAAFFSWVTAGVAVVVGAGTTAVTAIHRRWTRRSDSVSAGGGA